MGATEIHYGQPCTITGRGWGGKSKYGKWLSLGGLDKDKLHEDRAEMGNSTLGVATKLGAVSGKEETRLVIEGLGVSMVWEENQWEVILGVREGCLKGLEVKRIPTL
jgi:hypothetical protein